MTAKCIYCKLLKEMSQEHLVPSSLGGNLTAPLLCRDCNGRRLSGIDQALAETSVISLARVLQTPKEAFDAYLGGVHMVFDEDTGLHAEVRVVSGYEARMLPQVHVRPDGPGHAVTVLACDPESYATLFAYLAVEAPRRFEAVKVKIESKHGAITPRLVLHRSKEGFIRAASDEDVRLLVDVLAAGAAQIQAQYRDNGFDVAPIAQPHVRTKITINPNKTNRAVAKIAFNLLAYSVGSEAMQVAALDPIRAYILGDGLVPRLPLEPGGPPVIDDRFLNMLATGSGDVRPRPRTLHQVVLFDDLGTTAWVTLYGADPFLVQLTEAPLPIGRPHVFEFAGDRQLSREVPLEEVIARMQEDATGA